MFRSRRFGLNRCSRIHPPWKPPVLGAVEARFAHEALDGDLAVGVWQHGALGRELDRLHPVLPDVVQEEGDGGVRPELERHGRREVRALLVHEVDEVVAVEVEADRAHGDGLVGVQRAAKVERTLVEVVAADGEAQVVVGLEARAFADEIDDAAWGHLAVEHRRGPLENLDPLHPEELLVDPEARIGAEAVQEDRVTGEEASDREPVETAPAVLVEHARHPVERLGKGQELLRVELLSIDDVHGGRHLDERGVRLRAGGRFLHAVALVKQAAHGQGIERDRRLRRRGRGGGRWRARGRGPGRRRLGERRGAEQALGQSQSASRDGRRHEGSKTRHVRSPLGAEGAREDPGEPRLCREPAHLRRAGRRGGASARVRPWRYRGERFGRGELTRPPPGHPALLAGVDGPARLSGWLSPTGAVEDGRPVSEDGAKRQDRPLV